MHYRSNVSADQAPGVARDHQLLVGRNHPYWNAAACRADARPGGLIGGRIELDPEPGGIAANALADRCCVFADAAGEHQRIEAAERRCERTKFASYAIYEEVDGLPGARIRTFQQFALMSLEIPETPSSPDC